jgi:2',3'-cyclic-nucleotide 2'-phosphodiesterase (5'-nucleotidase family)
VFLKITKSRASCLLQALLIFASPIAPILADTQNQPEREVVVLAINDVYRIEGVEGRQRGGMSLVRALRRQLEQQAPDLLFLHGGDFLFPSLISEWTKGAHMVEMMNALDGSPGIDDPRMFVVFGNHEFDRSRQKHAALLQARIDQSEFQWLGTNIRFVQEDGKPLVASDNLQVSSIVESGGVRVGIFGLTTDKRPANKIAYVDEFIDPVRVAMEQTKLLREQGAEVVIALTHLPLEKDREILEKLGDRGPHLIIGGHEHQRHHVEIDGRWILKADADARTATVARIRMIGQRPFISFGYRFLDRDRLKPDPEMQKRVDQVLKEHEAWFCADHHEEAGCLQRSVGETAVPLIGEELEIRSYETNLGNWVADQVRSVVEDADIAFINAGSLRVNQDIPPGPITQRDLEELLPYDSELVQIELDNNQLDQILERATKDWSGKGYWLQISGFAFKHDPRKVEGHRVDAISLLQGGKMMKLPDRPLQAITYKYLVKGGDGYDMLKSLKWVSVAGSLKERLRETLRGSIEPIQPRVDGRICNITELQKRPCAFKIGTTP